MGEIFTETAEYADRKASLLRIASRYGWEVAYQQQGQGMQLRRRKKVNMTLIWLSIPLILFGGLGFLLLLYAILEPLLSSPQLLYISDREILNGHAKTRLTREELD